MHIVMKSEKRLRATVDNGNCDGGIPGYRGQHRISPSKSSVGSDKLVLLYPTHDGGSAMSDDDKYISYSKRLWVGSATRFCDGSWSVIVHITDQNRFNSDRSGFRSWFYSQYRLLGSCLCTLVANRSVTRGMYFTH